MALFHSFANLFIIWLKRNQLDSHGTICSQSVVQSPIMELLENSTVHSWRSESPKAKQHLSMIITIVLILWGPERVLGVCRTFLDQPHSVNRWPSKCFLLSMPQFPNLKDCLFGLSVRKFVFLEDVAGLWRACLWGRVPRWSLKPLYLFRGRWRCVRWRVRGGWAGE